MKKTKGLHLFDDLDTVIVRLLGGYLCGIIVLFITGWLSLFIVAFVLGATGLPSKKDKSGFNSKT